METILSDSSAIAPSATRLAFVGLAGEERSKGSLLSMGPVLEIMNLVAGGIASRYTKSPPATIMFNRVDMLRPVFHGDLVRVEGQAIHVGQSAITVQCSGYRMDDEANVFQLTHVAVVTTVGIGRHGKPMKGLAKLMDENNPEYCKQLEALATKRQELVTRLKMEQMNVDKLISISPHNIWRDEGKNVLVPVKSTELELRHWFSPKSLNPVGTVTGSVLLAWMDDAAKTCARKFTKNDHVAAVAMSHVLFRRAISASDIATLRARICHVRQYQVDVEVEVFTSNPLANSTSTKTHSGYFTFVNLNTPDSITDLKPIQTGLLVNEQDQDEMKYLLKAQKRWVIDQEEQEHLLRLVPLPISLAHGVGVVAQPVTSSRL